MGLDMGLLVQAQGRTDLEKREDEQTQNLQGTKRDNHISTSSEQIISSSEHNEKGIGEGLQSEKNDDFLDNDSIKIQFEHLNKAQICSEISIAYSETLKEFKESNTDIKELAEVLQRYHLNPFDHVQINMNNEFETERDSPLHPDKYLWNLLLFAIHYDQTEIVEYLLSLKEIDPMAILAPPNSNQEFHIKDGRHNRKQLAIELAVKNKNLKVVELIFDKFQQTFNNESLCEIAKTIGLWDEGMKLFLKSDVTKQLFSHFRPEDKELFVQACVEPMLSE